MIVAGLPIEDRVTAGDQILFLGSRWSGVLGEDADHVDVEADYCKVIKGQGRLMSSGNGSVLGWGEFRHLACFLPKRRRSFSQIPKPAEDRTPIATQSKTDREIVES